MIVSLHIYAHMHIVLLVQPDLELTGDRSRECLDWLDIRRFKAHLVRRSICIHIMEYPGVEYYA